MLRALVLILLSYTVYKIVQLNSPVVIHELPEKYMENIKERYYSKYMTVQSISGKKWEAGIFRCSYYKVVWSDDDKFVLENPDSEGKDNALVLGHHEVMESFGESVWVKGPVHERFFIHRFWRGDVKDCFEYVEGRIPNLFEAAKEPDTWYEDLFGRVVVISNSKRTYEVVESYTVN